jgi:hypothetical protein
MRFGFEEILEQHRSDLNGRDQLSTETRRRLERQVTIIRTSIYATPRNSRSDVIQSGPATNAVRA